MRRANDPNFKTKAGEACRVWAGAVLPKLRRGVLPAGTARPQLAPKCMWQASASR